jgi:hypothetical protein|tara:strand:- start:160 stop:528 length:369 start_codon:yes stop_codon:yes gene_type:complete
VQILQILVGQILAERDHHIIKELVAVAVVLVLLVKGQETPDTLMVVMVLPSVFQDLRSLMLVVAVAEEHRVQVDLVVPVALVAVMPHQDQHHHSMRQMAEVLVAVEENHPVVMVEMAVTASL